MPTNFNRCLLSLLASNCILTISATYTWPNYAMDELEHLLVDGGGFNEGGLQTAITPCTNYVQGDQLLGLETAAQWIRVAFHDFATADVSAGTGGIDASIGFETLRPENAGPDVNDTIGFLSSFVNAHVSMADLISLSVVAAVGGCSSPMISIPLRAGRIDATESGVSGVPEPQTDIQDTLDRLAGAGFNQSESIALTACGHTMGGVSHAGFPQIVLESAVTPTNLDGFSYFDTTPAVFDVDVVNEYLDGTGQKGGPLVTTENVTLQSDLRLYASDNNATLQGLASSSENFVSTCVDVFTRMINTVPSGVTLTDIIIPNAAKPVSIRLTVDTNGNVAFSGYIRLLSSVHSKDSVVTITWAPRTGSGFGAGFVAAELTQTGTGIYGTTYYHNFSVPINPGVGISAFHISVKDGLTITSYTNGGNGYPVQDSVIWLSDDVDVLSTEVSVSTALLSPLAPSSVHAVFSVPTPQDGTLSPKVVTSSTALTRSSTRGLYTVYSGSTTLSLTYTNQISVDIVAVTSTGVVVENEFNKLTLSS